MFACVQVLRTRKHIIFEPVLHFSYIFLFGSVSISYVFFVVVVVDDGFCLFRFHILLLLYLLPYFYA